MKPKMFFIVTFSYVHSYPNEMGTIFHGGPVACITSTTDLTTTKSPRLRKSYYSHPQPPELV